MNSFFGNHCLATLLFIYDFNGKKLSKTGVMVLPSVPKSTNSNLKLKLRLKIKHMYPVCGVVFNPAYLHFLSEEQK